MTNFTDKQITLINNIKKCLEYINEKMKDTTRAWEYQFEWSPYHYYKVGYGLSDSTHSVKGAYIESGSHGGTYTKVSLNRLIENTGAMGNGFGDVSENFQTINRYSHNGYNQRCNEREVLNSFACGEMAEHFILQWGSIKASIDRHLNEDKKIYENFEV